LVQSPSMTKLYCAPGNAGIAALAACVPLAAADVSGLRASVQEQSIDLTVVGPEGPLAVGIVDDLRKHKLRIFGPHKAAARIESIKSSSKDLTVPLGIPTAESKTC